MVGIRAVTAVVGITTFCVLRRDRALPALILVTFAQLLTDSNSCQWPDLDE